MNERSIIPVSCDRTVFEKTLIGSHSPLTFILSVFFGLLVFQGVLYSVEGK